MMGSIIVAVITGVCAILGSIISARITTNQQIHKIDVNNAVIDTKLTALTDEVRQHNNFASRLPVIEEQIKVINHRIDDLERGSK